MNPLCPACHMSHKGPLRGRRLAWLPASLLEVFHPATTYFYHSHLTYKNHNLAVRQDGMTWNHVQVTDLATRIETLLHSACKTAIDQSAEDALHHARFDLVGELRGRTESCAKSLARIFASNISPHRVENAQLNVELFSINWSSDPAVAIAGTVVLVPTVSSVEETGATEETFEICISPSQRKPHASFRKLLRDPCPVSGKRALVPGSDGDLPSQKLASVSACAISEPCQGSELISSEPYEGLKPISSAPVHMTLCHETGALRKQLLRVVMDSARTVLGEHGITLEDWTGARQWNKQKLWDVATRMVNGITASGCPSQDVTITTQHSPRWCHPRYKREARWGIKRIELVFEVATEPTSGGSKTTTGISLTDEGLERETATPMREGIM